MPTLTSSQLTKLSNALLKAAGASDAEAAIVTKLLVESNLAGVDSHGVFPNLMNYVKGLREGTIKSGVEIERVREGTSSVLIDGKWGLGQVVCAKAMEIAIQKASKTGVCAVGIFNCNHIGRLSDYSKMALEHDMIGFVAVNSDPGVAPYGGVSPILATAPLSYAIPASDENPIVVDFATSVAAEGKVRAALYKGLQLPPGWIVDSNGHPSTNPADLYEPPLPPKQVKLAGALLPAGGHKGYSLALVVEALAGALTGSGCDGEVTYVLTNGVFILVLKVDDFVPSNSFKSRIDRLIRSVKNSRKAEGVQEILIPGEPEFREEKKRSKDGISIPNSAWEALEEGCREFGLDASRIIRE
jgi:uncharacterized oxidoreductase